MGESEWLLKPGDKILRKDLHQRYGGRRGGGIGPSTLTANVLIFAEAPHPDPVSSAPRIGEAFVLTGARQSQRAHGKVPDLPEEMKEMEKEIRAYPHHLLTNSFVGEN